MHGTPNAGKVKAVSHDGDLVKLVLRGPDGEVETPWAERVGEREFRLDNLPWFAYGISDDDVVEADPTESEGTFEFVRVLRPSGNHLVRVIIENESHMEALLGPIVEMGCHYEAATRKFIAISVPSSVSLEDVTTYLTNTDLEWEYANPTYEQLFDKDR